MAEFCTIKRALAAYRADGADDGTDPDKVAVQGKVTLTPVLSTGAVTMYEDGALVTVPLQPMEARIQNGQVRYRGAEGIRVVAGGQGMNPKTIVYKATFSEMQAGGWSFKLPAIQFEAVPGGEVDLTLVAPVPNAPNGVVRGPAGTSISDVLVEGTDLVVMVTDESGTRELSRLPLDDVVAAEAQAAAQSVKDELAAELGDASESASKAKAEADRATEQATAAAGSADAAHADAVATAADRAKTTADATATAADRVATAADRTATGEHRVAAAQSATTAEGAAATATEQADRATTEADRSKTEADRAEAAADLAGGAAVQAVTERVDTLLAGAPEAYDTLSEIAEKLADQDDVASAMTAQIGQKVDRTSTGNRVYATDPSGNQTALAWQSGTAAADSVAVRGSGGRLLVGDPTVSGHAANKAYVDAVKTTANAALPASKIQVVSALPASPVAGTIYLVTGA